MKKTVLALAAVATIAAASFVTPKPAEARCTGCAVGAGILGGLAAGAIIGSAIASHPGYYTYEYDADAPYECPYGGYWARKRLYDRWGNPVGWSRPHYFCR